MVHTVKQAEKSRRQFHKVLIANRGEIAARIIRACHGLQIKTVAIFSEEDSGAPFLDQADETCLIGRGRSPVEAYLAMDDIIRLAQDKMADAIHPGYGFLAENADFARRCQEAGLVFIGPSPEMMSALGDKVTAKQIARSVGVPTIPGMDKPLESEAEALSQARLCGYPVIIKASAGGGGRGVRVVRQEAELIRSYQSAQREAVRAFGREDVYLEKYIEQPRHVEVQILGDHYGSCVHLYERDCSIQRRHQKVIEIAPAFVLTEEKRQAICNDALKIAKAVRYANAGTVEFLLDQTGSHYFIEVNPRIQVEHTVTEEVTGIDIVQSQILIAQGCALSEAPINISGQESIILHGCAIQCRVTTEDPANQFMPDTGEISRCQLESGFGIRIDNGSGYVGMTIPPYYDSLLLKMVVWGRSFEEAVRKAAGALRQTRISGVKTNIGFLVNVLEDKDFRQGSYTTNFIAERPQLCIMPQWLEASQQETSSNDNQVKNESQSQPQSEKQEASQKHKAKKSGSKPGTAEKIQAFQYCQEKLKQGGGSGAIDRQHQKGKYTARERLNRLFDLGTFVELDQLVAHRCQHFGMAQTEVPGEGVITGYGTIDGRLVYAYAQDFTVMGGSLGEMHAKKICKVMDLAKDMGAPVIGINDSGGARIQEGVDALSGYGQIFYRNTRLSGVVPQITMIMGPCAGGAVYSPALTDFIFMVKNTSQMFITGPDVIKTVTGEQVTLEKLGGAITHNHISGNAHFAAEDEESCIQQVKTLLSYLPGNNKERPPQYQSMDPAGRIEYSLNSIIPDRAAASYDMKNIIQKIADNGEFFEIQKLFAPNLLIGFIRLDGKTIGVVANQPKAMAGTLDINASDKAARFIRFCDAYGIPLLNLVDVPGFLPGSDQEYDGIIRHGAKMLYAYSEATVGKVTLIIRKAYGGAYIAMCSKELGADQVIAWPTAEIAVMGAEGAANIVFKKEIAQAEDSEQKRAEMIRDYEDNFATPYIAAKRGYVDMVIEPAQTRPVLVNAFEMLASKRGMCVERKHGIMPV